MSSPVEHRGLRVPSEYSVDIFAQITVGQVMEAQPRTIIANLLVGELADRIGANDPEVCHHPALLVTKEDGALAGIITRRDLLAVVEAGRSGELIRGVMSRPPIFSLPEESLREALERIHTHDVGRMPVVDPDDPRRLLGYLGRGAILSARRVYALEHHAPEQGWLGVCLAPLDFRNRHRRRRDWPGAGSHVRHGRMVWRTSQIIWRL